MAMENGPFEDVFLLKMGIFHGYVSLPEGEYPFRWGSCVEGWG